MSRSGRAVSHRTQFSVFSGVDDDKYLHLDRLPKTDPRYKELKRPELRSESLRKPGDDSSDNTKAITPNP